MSRQRARELTTAGVLDWRTNNWRVRQAKKHASCSRSRSRCERRQRASGNRDVYRCDYARGGSHLGGHRYCPRCGNGLLQRTHGNPPCRITNREKGRSRCQHGKHCDQRSLHLCWEGLRSIRVKLPGRMLALGRPGHNSSRLASLLSSPDLFRIYIDPYLLGREPRGPNIFQGYVTSYADDAARLFHISGRKLHCPLLLLLLRTRKGQSTSAYT